MFQISGGESYVSGVEVNSKTSRFVQDSSLQLIYYVVAFYQPVYDLSRTIDSM